MLSSSDFREKVDILSLRSNLCALRYTYSINEWLLAENQFDREVGSILRNYDTTPPLKKIEIGSYCFEISSK